MPNKARLVTAGDFDWSISRLQETMFQTLWPDGAEITLENAQRAIRNGLSLRCAARNLLGPKRLAQFEEGASTWLRAYREAIRPGIVEVQRLRQEQLQMEAYEAQQQLDAQKGQLWAEYQESLAVGLVAALGK